MYGTYIIRYYDMCIRYVGMYGYPRLLFAAHFDDDSACLRGWGGLPLFTRSLKTTNTTGDAPVDLNG